MRFLALPLLVSGVTAAAAGSLGAQQAGVYSDSQAQRGALVFRRVCGDCHVSSQFSSAAFRDAWRGRPAAELFELIRTTMPQDNPGRLRRQEYADVLAYVFRLNGVPAGSSELPASDEQLRQVVFQPAGQPPREQ